MNYFEYFGIPVSFRVDSSNLRKLYLSNSRSLHPDINATSLEEHSINETALNNKAYSILKDDAKRTLYILEELFPPLQKATLSPLFLGEMMEYNEDLMEAKMKEDIDQIQNVSDKLIELNSNIETEIEVLKSLFDSGKEEVIDEIRVLVLKKNYLQRSLSQV